MRPNFVFTLGFVVRNVTNFTPNLGIKSQNFGPKLLGHSLIPSIVIKYPLKESEYATSEESYESMLGF